MLKIIQLNLKLREKKIQCLSTQLAPSSSSPTLFTSDWASLPEDILDEIIKKMCYVDYSTFPTVCKSVGLMYIDRFCCLPRNIPFGVPILFLNAYKSDSNFHKFVKMNGEIESDNIYMPEVTNKWVCGSSWGWLVLEAINSRQASLLNPFTRRVIRLPSIDTFACKPDVPVKGFNYIHKAILSTNPTISEQDCIILAIVGKRRELAYCKIGDKKWRNIECCFWRFCDVIYYNRKFYATTDYGYLVSCELIDPNLTKTIFLAPPIDSNYPRRKYLVMASGRLLILHKAGKDRFKFHLLNKCSPSALNHDWQYNWVEKNSIDDQLLFIGNNDSFSLPVQSNSSRANCIYFTENAFGWVESNHDHDNHSFGMYDIAKKKLNNGEVWNEVFRSFWMIPSPW